MLCVRASIRQIAPILSSPASANQRQAQVTFANAGPRDCAAQLPSHNPVVRAYLERAVVWTALWWVVFGIEFGEWLGWENAIYALGTGFVLAFLEFGARVVLAAMRRRFARPS
jgi:hypothetical protein